MKHLPQLDGLRGIAVLIVVVGHLIVFDFGFGIKKLGPLPPVGVDLFFVLSGFLITNVLLQTRGGGGRAYYLNFYARRALRIWPLYALMLILLFSVCNYHVHTLSLDGSEVRWPYFAFFAQNLVYWRGLPAAPLALAGMWSLAVEEQFYLLWPVCVRRLGLRHLAAVLVFVIAMAPLVRAMALSIGADPYTNPLCRFDGMAFGGLAALWISARRPDSSVIRGHALRILGVAAVGEVAILPAGLEHYLSKTFMGLAFCALLLLALSSPALRRVLSKSWLRYVGKISYGLYLFHALIAAIVVELIPGRHLGVRIVRVAVILALSLGAAALSWHCFEQPILRLKRHFAPGVRRSQGAEVAEQALAAEPATA